MKSTTTNISILLSIIILVLAGCKDENAVPSDPGHDYFPTQIGSWVEYLVDSVHVEEQIQGDTVHIQYLMRVELDTVWLDAQGRLAQRITRSVLDSTTGTWVIRDVWSQFRNNTLAERTEENVRKMRMAFSVRPNLFWNLNVFNTEEEREMTYKDIDEPWSTGTLAFDSTVTVVTTVSNNLIDTVFDTERYAKNVGMVYKRWVETNTQYVTQLPPLPPLPRTQGHRLTMTATAYGVQ